MTSFLKAPQCMFVKGDLRGHFKKTKQGTQRSPDRPENAMQARECSGRPWEAREAREGPGEDSEAREGQMKPGKARLSHASLGRPAKAREGGDSIRPLGAL